MNAEEIAQQSNQLHGFYRLRFAGRSRVTRSPQVASKLAEDAARILEAAKTAKAPAELIDQLKERAELYSNEANMVGEAVKRATRAEREAAEIAQRASIIEGFYARHFAFQNRLTRDLLLLDEVINDLSNALSYLGELRASLSDEAWENYSKGIRGRLELFTEERDAIREAIQSATPASNASRLAALANSQFNIYKHLFSGKARLSRRPGLLERMLTNLKGIHDEMNELEQRGFGTEDNAKNIEIVQGRIDAFERELKAIQDERAASSLDDLVGAFGKEANSIMSQWDAEFAGRPRVEVSQELIVALCDGMTEVLRQSDDLEQRVEHEINSRNLELMSDFAWMLHQEFLAISEAQRSKD